MLSSLIVEHRRHSRSPLSVPIGFTPRGAQGAARAVGSSRDLSLGGMYVETASPLAFGSEVTVYFRLPGYDREIEISAVVRWTQRDGMGLQFGSIGARDTHAITEATRHF